MPSRTLLCIAAVALAWTVPDAEAQDFPRHWGDPPIIQTRDLAPLPGGYGRGSSTLANWIRQHLDRDAARGVGQREVRIGKGVLARGELRQDAGVALVVEGPPPDEGKLERRVSIRLTHRSGSPDLTLRAEAVKETPTRWEAQFLPKKAGRWTYRVSFTEKPMVAAGAKEAAVAGYDGRTGSLTVASSAAPRE